MAVRHRQNVHGYPGLGVFHCRLFAQDQHFDSQGMFISTVLCLPVIVNCCVLVVSETIEFWCIDRGCLDALAVRVGFSLENLCQANEESTHRTKQASEQGQERIARCTSISNVVFNGHAIFQCLFE